MGSQSRIRLRDWTELNWGSDYLCELKKDTLIYSQAEGQGPLRQAIKYDYNNKSNKKQINETVYNMESELASSLKERE